MKTDIAPPVAICATCETQCGNELVTVAWAFDRIANGKLPVFRHASSAACDRARNRSVAFWSGQQERANAA